MHPDLEEEFLKYLSEPCDQDGCDKAATHNQSGKKFCNEHMDWNKPAFARND